MKRRVLIVGGGIAGLTAAYELTRTPEGRASWDVEVVEMGHRFGGRLASAHRTGRWHRNEEHGLHVWFGFYDNTFRMAEQVFEAWKAPVGFPYATIWDALRPIHHSDHAFRRDDRFVFFRSHHPRNCDRPGVGIERTSMGRLTTVLDGLRAIPRTLLAWTRDTQFDGPRPTRVSDSIFPPPGREATLRRIGTRLDRILRRVSRIALDASPETRVARGARIESVIGRLHGTLVGIAATQLGDDGVRRELVAAVDLVLAFLRAVLSPTHGILHDGDLDRVSRFELRELLAMHGARASTLNSRLLDSLYDMPFAYEGGDRSKPMLEASTALRFSMRIVGGYKHAIAYLLRAGAGETLVAPLYEVLASRGVRFRPFHRLDRLTIDSSKRELETLTFVRAARIKDGYDPLETRDGLRGFRSEPDFDHLEDGDALRRRGVDFYSRFGDRGETDEVTLRVGCDFDDVILALPLGCIEVDGDGHSPVAAWITHHPKARTCLDRLHLVPTVAAQLWLDEPPEARGLDDRAVVTWVPPYSVFCEMSPVIAHERWGHRGPKNSLYLCGAHPLDAHRAPSSDPAARARDFAVARTELEALVESRAGIDAFGGRAALHRPDGETDPYAAQYVRANVEPWDLADLSRPGADAVRLEATDTGLTNLSLAGSWVRTHVNTTSLEAATSSGIAAARALGALVQPIIGESFLRKPSAVPVLPGRVVLRRAPESPNTVKPRSWRPDRLARSFLRARRSEGTDGIL